VILVSRNAAERSLGSSLRFEVDPRSISHYVDPPLNQLFDRLYATAARFPKSTPLIKRADRMRRECFIAPGRWDLAARPIEETKTYKRMADILEHVDNVERSAFYADALAKIEAKGRFRHKKVKLRSRADLDDFFAQYFGLLLQTMKSDGYRPDLAAGRDVPLVVVTRAGNLVKSRGARHRWAAARLVDVERFPVVISHVHSAWIWRVAGGKSGISVRRLSGALDALQARHSAPQPLHLPLM
jgi:hypothetical protein